MIRVVKPAHLPAALVRGVDLVQAHEDELAADPSAGGSKERPFKFRKTVYGPRAVKVALRNAQHAKCCYCEGKFEAQASGDVEHYRPKTCSRQNQKTKPDYPGYWWLAYEWYNLYYSCENCNRAGKKNLFPLADAALRARSPEDRIDNEGPMLLDPGGDDDPRNHIRFRGAACYALTPQGQATIDLIKLSRGPLTVARNEHLKLVDALKTIVATRHAALSDEQIEKVTQAESDLAACKGPAAAYSSMVIDYLD